MRQSSLLKEEVLHYLNEEWVDSLREHKNGLWLTTRGFQLKLKSRGVITTWPTLNLRLKNLLNEETVEMIQTSNGECWKPIEDSFRI